MDLRDDIIKGALGVEFMISELVNGDDFDIMWEPHDSVK